MAAVDLTLPRHHPSFGAETRMSGRHVYSDNNTNNHSEADSMRKTFDFVSPSDPRNSVSFPYRLSSHLTSSNGSLAEFAAVVSASVAFGNSFSHIAWFGADLYLQLFSKDCLRCVV